MKVIINVCYEIKKESIYRFYEKSDKNLNWIKIRKINGINEYKLLLYQIIDISNIKNINIESIIIGI